MKIVITDRFNNELNEMLEFIATDSIDMAVKFHSEIYDSIHSIPFMANLS